MVCQNAESLCDNFWNFQWDVLVFTFLIGLAMTVKSDVPRSELLIGKDAKLFPSELVSYIYMITYVQYSM